jgi:hypothetical protein
MHSYSFDWNGHILCDKNIKALLDDNMITTVRLVSRMKDGQLIVDDIMKVEGSLIEVEEHIRAIANREGKCVDIFIDNDCIIIEKNGYEPS